MKDREYVFVYGTLRKNAPGGMSRLLSTCAELVGEATFQGKLFQVADYPGATVSEHPGDIVHGEVYALGDAGRALHLLDEYEECGPAGSGPAEYRRERIAVNLAAGIEVQAWVYLYNLSTENLERIRSGDFVAFAVRQLRERAGSGDCSIP